MKNKKRLIYADDIVKVAEHAFNEWNLAMAAADGEREINHVYKMQELCKAVKAVAENAPTIDAVEVVHGRWVDNGIKESMLSACSVCGFPCGAYTFNYCPNCGAKMDGERKDNG